MVRFALCLIAVVALLLLPSSAFAVCDYCQGSDHTVAQVNTMEEESEANFSKAMHIQDHATEFKETWIDCNQTLLEQALATYTYEDYGEEMHIGIHLSNLETMLETAQLTINSGSQNIGECLHLEGIAADLRDGANFYGHNPTLTTDVNQAYHKFDESRAGYLNTPGQYGNASMTYCIWGGADSLIDLQLEIAVHIDYTGLTEPESYDISIDE